MIHVLGLLASMYLLVWGVTWLIGDRSIHAFGETETGSAFVSYPGVFLGGLPPTPPIDALPILAIVVSAAGLAVLIVRVLRWRGMGRVRSD
jgi:hypothetical protein